MAKLQKKSIEKPDRLNAVLKQFWGYESFRPLQREIIMSVLEGRDTMALMPTGGGKSLTFQIPALITEGICIVVTPLIALMKDQVDQLIAKKIKAAALHSGMNRSEISMTLDNCVFGGYKFLYVSPERLGTELFRMRLRDMRVNLLAVDEAHCISQWGYDFRPSYLEISKIREELDGVPILALTATATPDVCEDVQEKLGFKSRNLLKKSFNRENLAYVVRKTENKEKELVSICKKLDACGIVYTRNRKKCRELALKLKENGISASWYHAGLQPGERQQRQKEWTGDEFRVMVATNAFGMGIDKPDVRFVIHVDLPDSPEAYFQEAGRAGRDEEKSWSILLYSGADKKLAAKRIKDNFPEIKEIRKVYTAACNYLQIPLGSGRGHSYDFEFGEFLHRYRFQAMVALSALRILAGEGYLALTDAFDNPSRIKFLARREELYSFQVNNAEFDAFIRLLLRSYSGLFSGYVRIEESYLARKTAMSLGRVVDFLKALSSRKIINYIPRKNVPVLTLLEERLDEKNLFISPERYSFRKERFEKRLGEIVRYASSEKFCRNQFLLGYFGQLRSRRCKRCDVCLERITLGTNSQEFRDIEKELYSVVEKGPVKLDELVDGISAEREDVIDVLEHLLQTGKLVRSDELRITLPT